MRVRVVTAGHEVAGLQSVGEARASLLARGYDVAVLDLHLGTESGLTVAMLAVPELRSVAV